MGLPGTGVPQGQIHHHLRGGVCACVHVHVSVSSAFTMTLYNIHVCFIQTKRPVEAEQALKFAVKVLHYQYIIVKYMYTRVYVRTPFHFYRLDWGQSWT